MVDKCKGCGAKIISAPISKISFWEGDPFKSRFQWEAFRWENLILKNMFKIDLFSVSFLIIILYMAWAYNADLDQYIDISENPCGFCAGAATQCSYNKDRNFSKVSSPFLITDIIPLENIIPTEKIT